MTLQFVLGWTSSRFEGCAGRVSAMWRRRYGRGDRERGQDIESSRAP
jgi:hypothetical protein